MIDSLGEEWVPEVSQGPFWLFFLSLFPDCFMMISDCSAHCQLMTMKIGFLTCFMCFVCHRGCSEKLCL
uniref:Uncharacterized protein n=1 Tax=Anguilla anguilla TaxID=7936 RepID=A0A0E9WM61_ANGAN